MRNRMLAGLGVAALATVGLAAPANAISSTSADVYVVHAFPGLTVDISVNGSPVEALQDFEPMTSAGPLDLPAGEYTIEVFADGAAEGDAPAIEGTFTLAANTSYTVVAHPTEDGSGAALTAFQNDISEIPAGQGKVTVRHTAAAPAVNVNTGSTQLNEEPLTLGDELVLGPLPAGTIADVNVTLADGGARAIELGDVTLPAGTNIFVHAYGPMEDESYSAVIFTIDGLGATPAGVPAGEAGLGQQSNGGWTRRGVTGLP